MTESEKQLAQLDEELAQAREAEKKLQDKLASYRRELYQSAGKKAVDIKKLAGLRKKIQESEKTLKWMASDISATAMRRHWAEDTVQREKASGATQEFNNEEGERNHVHH